MQEKSIHSSSVLFTFSLIDIDGILAMTLAEKDAENVSESRKADSVRLRRACSIRRSTSKRLDLSTGEATTREQCICQLGLRCDKQERSQRASWRRWFSRSEKRIFGNVSVEHEGDEMGKSFRIHSSSAAPENTFLHFFMSSMDYSSGVSGVLRWTFRSSFSKYC